MNKKYLILLIALIIIILFLFWFFHTPPAREGTPCPVPGSGVRLWGPCGKIPGESPFHALLKHLKGEDQVVY